MQCQWVNTTTRVHSIDLNFQKELMKNNILLDLIFKNSPGCPRGVLGVTAPSVSKSPWVSVKRNPRPSRALTIFPQPSKHRPPPAGAGVLGLLSADPESLFIKESQHHLTGNLNPHHLLLYLPHCTYRLRFVFLQTVALFMTSLWTVALSMCPWMGKLARKAHTETCTRNHFYFMLHNVFFFLP